MTEKPAAPASLGEIALCLSGGGYRAAAFHLGTMKMLDKLGILKNVNQISTVSGGTIVGMAFVLSRIDGKESFDDFFTRFRKFLKEANVIELGFDNIKKTSASNGSVSKISLIRAAANVYENKLFEGRRFGELLDAAATKSLFKDMIFNATEFRGGNAFRFRAHYQNNDENPLYRKTIGNGNMRLKAEVARRVRLADIVAASSCFPGGFEPIVFPADFDLGAGALPEYLFTDKKGDDDPRLDKIPLMDGGIYDNQGLDSMTLSLIPNEFSEGEMQVEEITLPFDLLIISDTNQRNDNFLDIDPPEKKKPASKNIFKRALAYLPLIAAVSFALLIISFVLLIWRYISFINNPNPEPVAVYIHLLTYLFPIVLEGLLIALILVFFYFLYDKESFLDKAVGEIEIFGEKFPIGKYIGRMSFPELVNFATWRFKSLSAMTSQVFMKRIRRLTVESKAALPFFRRVIAFNYIYDLNPTLPRTKLENDHPELKVAERLRKISENAEKVETTLWFPKDDKENQLDNLIECGQATACFSILKFLAEHRQDEIVQVGTPENMLYEKALGIWGDIDKD